MSPQRLHIAVGVIFNPAQDKVLLSKRAADVHQGGLWEFPGGKCQHGEQVTQALERELFEELNLHVDRCQPMFIIDYDYPQQEVKLDIWSVYEWHGDIFGKEGQRIEWVAIEDLSKREFPAANRAILTALQAGTHRFRQAEV